MERPAVEKDREAGDQQPQVSATGGLDQGSQPCHHGLVQLLLHSGLEKGLQQARTPDLSEALALGQTSTPKRLPVENHSEYWNPDGRYKCSFATRQGLRLWRYDKTPVRRHVKVEGTRSPYDGDWVYWATRMGHYPMIAGRKATLLRSQKGRCPWCGLFFKQEDDVEIDHIIPRAKGGRDVYTNLQLLHGHCHDQKSALDKGCAVEEPCEVESLMHGSELAVG